MYLTAILITLGPGFAMEPHAFKLLENAGFELQPYELKANDSPLTSQTSFVFSNPLREETLRIEISKIENGSSVEERRVKGESQYKVIDWRSRDSDGRIPVGEFTSFRVGDFVHTPFYAVGGAGEVLIKRDLPKYRSANNKVIYSGNWSAADDVQLCEGVGRWLMADLTGRGMKQVQVSSFGRTYSGLRNSNGESFVNLNEWSSHQGYAYRFNESTATAMISVEGVDLIVPLASPKVKVGHEWQEISGIVPSYYGALYLPLSVVEKLSGH